MQPITVHDLTLALCAFVLVLGCVVMAAMQIPIPNFLMQGFLVVSAYYVGNKTAGS